MPVSSPVELEANYDRTLHSVEHATIRTNKPIRTPWSTKRHVHSPPLVYGTMVAIIYLWAMGIWLHSTGGRFPIDSRENLNFLRELSNQWLMAFVVVVVVLL